ncbi:hypothetical protein HMPREF1982_04428 [Clostridiales bacterium oral taxon 876 str. F0540]|nr:hypothetical protein HMPREF1982_04428 [Clostridiales bacterium oral taxon 876 str. F0540]
MVCNSCKGEFDNINGLKFCPYCGTKLEEADATKIKEIDESGEEAASAERKYDTLKMPVITEKQIKEYKRDKFFKELVKPFKNLKVVISIITLIVIMAAGGAGYLYFSGRTVDEGRIKEDLIGKAIVLPKGTSFDIKKGFIKGLSISERNTNKREKKDDIKVAVTLNNGSLEVKTLLALQYIMDNNKKWVVSDKISLAGDTSVKPLVGMDEKQILEGVKKLNINIGDKEKALSDEDVKTFKMDSRTPDFDNLKETAFIEAGIDSGIIASSGKIKCNLVFENEAWKIAGIERNSSEDFALALSPSFSQDKMLELIKKEPIEQSVSNATVFGGKSFFVNDSFTKSVEIADKKFDAQSKNLSVTVKRQNIAGEVKTLLSTDYTYVLSFDKVQLLKKSKTTAESVTISDVSKDAVAASLVNAQIEGSYQFLWFSDKHTITADEAKTFKTNKVTTKKGMENVKIVTGTITYNDGGKQKTSSIAAVYVLVYDNAKGYSWKLDRVVGEESANYRQYVSE